MVELTADTRYRAWKSWDAGRFAAPSDFSCRYFDKELQACGITRVGRVLEIGFGNGDFLGYARKKGWAIVGTEPNTELVGIARQAGFSAFDPEGFSLSDERGFDLIVLFDVLEHVPQDQAPAFLQSLAERLAAGGKILCRFPNGDSPLGRPFQHGDVTHVTVVGEYKMRFFAQSAGLELLRFSGQQRVVANYGRRTWFDHAVVRALELTVEPCIKNVLFRGCGFSLFSPNSIAVLGQGTRSGPSQPDRVTP